MAFLPFVHLGTRFHATPVGGSSESLCGEVDGKFAGAANYVVAVPLGAHRDVAHGWIGADGSGPTHSDDVVLPLEGAATHHHGRERINHCSWFPVLLHCDEEWRII